MRDSRTKQKDDFIIENLHFIKQIGCESKTALEKGDLPRFAELMHVHWEHKRKRSHGMTNSSIDECYEFARNNGALGKPIWGRAAAGS